jgi:hypothetical protein
MTLFACRFRRIVEFGCGPRSLNWVKRSLKLKPTPWFMATVLVVAVVAAKASAAEGAPTRPCAGGDLDGTYVLVDFQEFPVRGFTRGAQQAPYRFLAFFPPSTWSQMAFNMMPASPAKLMDVLRPQMQGRSFTLQANGRIVLNRGQAVQFAGSCAVSLHTGNGFHENDLILVGNEAGGESELHELFRRWTGGPVAEAVSTFDPAPSVAQEQPQPAAELPDVQPSLPDKPVPLRVNVVNGSGPNGPRTQVSVVVTNESHAPLSAFMLVFRGAQTAQRWKESDVDACLEHRPAWQPGQQWTKYIGMPIQVGNIEIFLGAAIFSDGSTWGNPHRLAKLKAHRGSCQWPGS